MTRSVLVRLLVYLVGACLAAPELAVPPLARGSESAAADQGAIQRTGHSVRAHRGQSRSKSVNRSGWIDQDSTPDDLDDESGRVCHPPAVTGPVPPRVSPHPMTAPVAPGLLDSGFRPELDRSPRLRC